MDSDTLEIVNYRIRTISSIVVFMYDITLPYKVARLIAKFCSKMIKIDGVNLYIVRSDLSKTWYFNKECILTEDSQPSLGKYFFACSNKFYRERKPIIVTISHPEDGNFTCMFSYGKIQTTAKTITPVEMACLSRIHNKHVMEVRGNLSEIYMFSMCISPIYIIKRPDFTRNDDIFLPLG